MSSIKLKFLKPLILESQNDYYFPIAPLEYINNIGKRYHDLMDSTSEKSSEYIWEKVNELYFSPEDLKKISEFVNKINAASTPKITIRVEPGDSIDMTMIKIPKIFDIHKGVSQSKLYQKIIIKFNFETNQMTVDSLKPATLLLFKLDIYRLYDEWYFCNGIPYSVHHISRILDHYLKNNKFINHFYYKCDQMDGLFKFINDFHEELKFCFSFLK